MRVANAKNRPAKNGGYFHWVDGSRGNVIERNGHDPIIKCGDWRFLNERYKNAATKKVEELAAALMLPIAGLLAFEVGWDGEAFTFPMKNERREIVGIRRRFIDGRKTAVPGSKNGLFIPREIDGELIFLPEGPTDSAALRSVGLNAIGRPACRLGEGELVVCCRGLRPIVVSDRDTPGRNGAKHLADMLGCQIIEPMEGKDMRQWINMGATKRDVLSLVGTDRRLT